MKKLIFSILGIIISAFLIYSSAQTVNVYYKSEKVYKDAQINGLRKQKCNNGKYGFINTKGKFIIKPIFDDVDVFKNEISRVKYNGKWGFINLHGKTIIEPIYEEASEFKNNLSLIKYNGKWGFINLEGKTIIEPIYEEASEFKNNLSLIKYNGKWGFINLEGKTIIEPIYEEASEFKNNLSLIKYNGKWGMINLEGKMVIDALYSNKPKNISIDVFQCLLFENDSINIAVLFKIINGNIIISNIKKYKNQGNHDVIIFKKDINTYIAHIYYNNNKFTIINSSRISSSEVLDKITYIKYNNKNNTPVYLILNNVKNEVIFDDVKSIKKHTFNNNLFIDALLKDSSRVLIKTDGTITTDFSSCGIKEKYDIFSSNHGFYNDGYGIRNSHGITCIPPIISNKEDITIKDGLCFVASKHIQYARRVFAYNSNNWHWYREVPSSESSSQILNNILDTIITKVEIDTININDVPFELSQNVKYGISINYEKENSLYKEEVINGTTYANNIFACYYLEKRDNYIKRRERISFYITCDTDPYNAHFISKENEDNEMYLIIKNLEFKVFDLFKQIFKNTFLFEQMIKNTNYFYRGHAFDNNYGIYASIPNSENKYDYYYFRPGIIGYLSNENVILEARVATYKFRNTIEKGILLLNSKNSTIEKYIDLSDYEDYSIHIDNEGFYLFNSNSPFLIRFDNNGKLIWRFNGKDGDYIADFDTNNQYVVITGYNTREPYYQGENPMTTILDKKTGKIIKRTIENYVINDKFNHFWTNVACRNEKYILQIYDDYGFIKTKIIKF